MRNIWYIMLVPYFYTNRDLMSAVVNIMKQFLLLGAKFRFGQPRNTSIFLKHPTSRKGSNTCPLGQQASEPTAVIP